MATTKEICEAWERIAPEVDWNARDIWRAPIMTPVSLEVEEFSAVSELSSLVVRFTRKRDGEFYVVSAEGVSVEISNLRTGEKIRRPK